MAKLPSGRPPLSLSPTHPPSRHHRRTFAALHPRCHTQPSKLIVLPHRSVVTRSVIIIRFKTNSLCRVRSLTGPPDTVSREPLLRKFTANRTVCSGSGHVCAHSSII